MIFNGICPGCGKVSLAERRVRSRGAQAIVDPEGDWWNVKCMACGKFIGYRPANGKSAEKEDDGLFQDANADRGVEDGTLGES